MSGLKEINLYLTYIFRKRPFKTIIFFHFNHQLKLVKWAIQIINILLNSILIY
jgi:hypothetical protein